MADLRSTMLEIYQRRGELSPPIVLEEAGDPDSPLHRHFTWDQNEAAHRWRLEEAHRLIQRVRVRYRETSDPDNDFTVRYFQAVPSNKGERQYVYEPVEQVAQDPFKRRLVLRSMEREWRTLRRRYESFVEFVEMIRDDLPEIEDESTGTE